MMKADEKQQELIKQFFKEWTTWCPEHVGYNLVAFIFIGISMVFWTMPCQIWNISEGYGVLGTMYMLELIGISLYTHKFTQYNEERKVKKLDELFRNLPVSCKQLRIFRIRKTATLCLWLAASTIICQTVFAAAFLHTFSVGNIWYPLLGHLIIPLADICGTGLYEEVSCGKCS